MAKNDFTAVTIKEAATEILAYQFVDSITELPPTLTVRRILAILAESSGSITTTDLMAQFIAITDVSTSAD